MKRREVKSKEEKERYTHLNAEFQRIARTYKKDFLSDQRKEIEGNNRIGKTSDFFKKIRDTKGTFHAQRSTIKDRNGIDLQKILRRAGKNTEVVCYSLLQWTTFYQNVEKKCKKTKWLSGEALQIAVERREGKSKREKER